MALFNSFTFDGENSLDNGIYISGEAAYNAPERVVEMITVPGRNGAIAMDQGRFENIEVTYPAGCFASDEEGFANKIAKFRNILASRYSYKRLTDTYNPDEFRMALYKSGLEVEPATHNRAGEFDITFDCKPQRYLISGETAVTPSDYGNPQTETGEIVTIDSDGTLGVKSLEVSLEPIQDLNGYDAPWVGGAGKNKLDTSSMSTATASGVTFSRASDGTITVGGKATASVYRTIGSFKTESGVQYTITGTPSGGASGKYRMTVVGYGYDYGSGYTFTGDGNSHDISVDIYTGYPSSGTLTFKPMIRLASETDATYEPYANICPISGRTEVVTHRAGKNLLPYPYAQGTITDHGITFTPNSDGTITMNGTATASAYYRISDDRYGTHNLFKLPNGNYKLTDGLSTPNNRYNIFMTAVKGTTVVQSDIALSNTRQNFSISDSLDYTHFRIGIVVQSGQTMDNVVFKPMIRLASDTDATYEPYNGQTYTTALGRTVYGGTLDVVSGVLTVDKASITLDGDVFSLSYNGQYTTGNTEVRFTPTPTKANGATNLIADRFRIVNYTSAQAEVGMARGNPTRDFIYFCVPSTVTSKAEAIAYFQANPTQVVYELATPQTYQLTPQEVELLLGENHLWSDGEITVTYGVHPYYNPTPFDAKPLIKVTGTGTLGIGEYSMTIRGYASQVIYIDCETMEAWEMVGGVMISRNDYIQNAGEEFPVLKPGANSITLGSGITRVEITPRWWRI